MFSRNYVYVGWYIQCKAVEDVQLKMCQENPDIQKNFYSFIYNNDNLYHYFYPYKKNTGNFCLDETPDFEIELPIERINKLKDDFAKLNPLINIIVKYYGSENSVLKFGILNLYK